MKKRPVRERFNEKWVGNSQTGCWEWTAHLDCCGYGQISTNGRSTSPAHRVSWQLHRAEIPEGLQVLHACDNPKCVNPDHLFLGTHADNMGDMTKKGRHWAATRTDVARRGSASGTAKFTEAQIPVVRAEHAAGASFRGLARKYSVDKYTIGCICKRQTWKHVP